MNASNIALPAGSVPGSVTLELRDVVLERGRQEGARAVGEGRARGKLGVQVLEPAPIEVVLQLGVRGRARPERVPRRQELVREPRSGEPFAGLDAAAELVLSLEDADVPAVPGEERGAREGVDTGADEDRVETRHGPTLSASPGA